MSIAVSIQGLSLGYGFAPAVADLDLAIAPQSLTALVGPNGAGKSTLLKALAGVMSPLSGRIELRGAQRRIAYLPQQSEIDRTFPLTVFDLVTMGLWDEIGAFGGVSRSQRARVETAIAAVGLVGFESRAIGALSGGQMQRALFARLLLQDAALVLLDEPFTAIDAKTTVDLIELVKNWRSEGRTILAALHDIDAVRAHFPQTLLLARRLVAHGATSEALTAENLLRARQMCEACDDPDHSCGRPQPPQPLRAAGSDR
ncbi:MAG: metal ABC transporter ATP-binding protein [Neomegalonema sp.]|nr:metal ABC transporter ATP-binding protein [Neomegalonema sp.]